MPELTIDDTPLRPVELTYERRITLGEPRGQEAGSVQRLLLGRPTCRPLPIKLLNAADKDFCTRHRESRYFLLAFPCSFIPDSSEPIERAWVEVELKSATAKSSRPPVVISIEPNETSASIKGSHKVKLGAGFRLLPGTLVSTPSFEREQSESFEKEEASLVAVGEGRSKFWWTFNRTRAEEIQGIYRLKAVIEASVGSQAEAEISASVEIRRNRWFFVFRSSVAADREQLTVTFGQP